MVPYDSKRDLPLNPSYKTQSVITSTGGRCLNAPNQKKKYSDISSQDNSILENSEQDENSVSKKCQNNKGLADIEDISSDEVVIESVKPEKSNMNFLHHFDLKIAVLSLTIIHNFETCTIITFQFLRNRW